MGQIKLMRSRAVAPLGRLVCNRFVPAASPAGLIERRSPLNPDDVVACVPFGGPEDIDDAVGAARIAARAWGELPLLRRCRHLERLGDELVAREQELALRLERETGRPLWECKRELQGLLERLHHTLAHADAALRPRLDGDARRVELAPLGVVVVLGPAMLPLATSHLQLLAALVGGNTVVWKPSPLVPASSQLYAEAWRAAGLPAGVINVVWGDDTVGAALAAHDDVDAAVFTGRRVHAVALARALADARPRKLVMHGGAKNAAIVLADAHLELAAYEVATSAFLTAGQRCTALSRVIVEASVAGPFVEILAAVCASFKIGGPRSGYFLGPLLSEERLARFLAASDGGVAEGNELIIAGGRLDRPGYFVAPRVQLVNQRCAASTYQREEHFGPDLAVYCAGDLDEAIAIANDSDYGLCASVFGRERAALERSVRDLRVGSILWNLGTSAASGRLPFGGVRASGHGGRGGSEAVRTLQREVSLQAGDGELAQIEPLPGVLEDAQVAS